MGSNVKRTKSTIAFLALAAVIVGVLLLWWSTEVALPWTAVLATLATVIVTIGVVNLVSDWFLQQSITDDLISLIQTDRRLIESGVDRFDRMEDTDWAELMGLDDRIECFVLDVAQFKSLIWPRMLDAAKSSLKTIELVVADVRDEGTRGEVSQRLAKPAADVSVAVNSLESDLEREWKAMKSSSTTRCTLTIRRSGTLPSYAYLESERMAAILLPPLSSQTGLMESRALVFRTERRGRTYASWFTSSSKALRSSFTSPAYSDSAVETKGL